MERTTRPYQYRRRPIQRALDEARRAARASDVIGHLEDVTQIRDRLPGYQLRRYAKAAGMMGLGQ